MVLIVAVALGHSLVEHLVTHNFANVLENKFASLDGLSGANAPATLCSHESLQTRTPLISLNSLVAARLSGGTRLGPALLIHEPVDTIRSTSRATIFGHCAIARLMGMLGHWFRVDKHILPHSTIVGRTHCTRKGIEFVLIPDVKAQRETRFFEQRQL